MKHHAQHHSQPYDLESTTDNGRTLLFAVLRCGLCHFAAFIGIKPDLPPPVVLRKFEQNGWVTNSRRKKIRCPECAEKPKGASHVMSKPPVHQPAPIVPTPPMRTMLKVLEAILESFDKEKGRYIGDHSDAWIAKQLDLAPAAVTKIREEAGFKLSEDPAISAMRNDIADAKAIIADVEKRFESFLLARAS
jgi:hypothetical protein